ncbi:MAG TPA: DNA polymerase IV [Candidatus Omnitrophota bacterium]|nr:DNA polymerase IV [Candidatus Omnitrophota bacterium]HQL41182.1 DNA polymerase IV [Candidatus Omnitrophota bacterium]
MADRVIAHVDMDAFFAAIEQRDNPQLRGKPVVIGADPKRGKGRGVVSTCSYEARKFGIHSAMPISQAYARCPRAVFLPVRMQRYSDVSTQIFSILYEFTPDVEPISIDEAFLDLSGTEALHGPSIEAARKIKRRIYDELCLTASVGVAPVKMVAKIASDHCKPDGLLEITKEKLLDFLWPLDVGKLWGVGPKTREVLTRMNIVKIGDMAKLSEDSLRQAFGDNGPRLYALAHGIDPRGVEQSQEVKSVSHEHTFEKDSDDKKMLYQILLILSEKVSRRLRLDGLQGRTITLKVRLKGFKTYTRSVTLPQMTNFVDDIFSHARTLFDRLYVTGTQVRLLGVRVSGFQSAYVQESLFERADQEKRERVHRAVDLIKDKFGERSIHRAI